jgi:hypothetical protein
VFYGLWDEALCDDHTENRSHLGESNADLVLPTVVAVHLGRHREMPIDTPNLVHSSAVTQLGFVPHWRSRRLPRAR